jgi:transposase
MEYKQGTPRDQLSIYETTLDDLVKESNPIRFIDAYVDAIDLEDLGVKMPELKRGTPPYDPAMMLKIFIYCYMDKIRSSRKIETECKRNIELMWLTGQLTPDFKTIADFRKNNREALKRLFKAFLQFCKKFDLLKLHVTATDGTKLRAQNGKNEVYNRERMESIEKRIDDKIQEYMKMLEMNDEDDEIEMDEDDEDRLELKKKLIKAKKRKAKIEEIQKEFDKDENLKTYYATDPDSSMQSDKGQKAPGYNAQSCVDGEHKLIIVAEITNEGNDSHQMTRMVSKIQGLKKELEIEAETVNIMDAGYDNEQEILNNQDKEGIEIIVQPKKVAAANNNKKKGNVKKKFDIEDFTYDETKDVYICPAGQELRRQYTKTEESGRKTICYQCYQCRNCQLKGACTENKIGRNISISVNKKEMDRFYTLMKEKAAIAAKRKEIVEHPFGTLKRNMGFTYFMQRGKENVEAEFKFMSFIYNLKRVLNIVPMDELLKAL